jgi:hypothetical protein
MKNKARRSMRQQVLKFSTGFATVLAAVAGGAVIGYSPAQAETFALRWTAVEAVQKATKADRLGTPARASESSVVFYNDPKAALTVATKIEMAAVNESTRKIREVPNENARQDKKKLKLPVGCEPSFSPVTTPSMANVTGRCLAAQEETTKVAGLAR